MLADLDRGLSAARVPYAVGGSVASTFHGEPRATQDVDVLVDLSPWRAAALRRELAAFAFLGDPREAAEAGRAFQALHRPTGWKVDFFPVRDEASRAELARRIRVSWPEGGAGTWLYTAEDILLRKLDWFRASGGILDRQLRDAAGILRVQAPRIDVTLLREVARRRGLSRELDRLLREAGMGG